MGQTFDTIDVLRLEVQRDAEAGETFNELDNPTGQLGGYGWITTVPGSLIRAVQVFGVTRLRYTVVGGTANWFTSEPVPVSAGEWVAARWENLAVPYYVRGQVQFLNAAGAVVGSSGQTGYLAVGSTGQIAATQAPTGTVSAWLRIDVYGNASGGNPVAAGEVDFTGATLAKAAAEADLPAPLPALDPAPYTDLLGPTHDLRVTREELNVGTLTATINDAALDPAASTLIRPGRRVRLLVIIEGAEFPEPLFTGRLSTAQVSYNLLHKVEEKRARIQITATDPASTLAGVTRSEGVAEIDELPYLLEGAGVPWNVNGSGNQVLTATVVAVNDNATALDQVAITRDSVRGYAWVDRRGILNAWDRDLLPLDVADTLDDTVYNADAFEIGYDLASCINSVTVTVTAVNTDTQDTEQVTYGPYVNADSIAEYGLQSAEFTVYGLTAAEVPTYAQTILDANAAPSVRVNALTVPIDTVEELPRALRDLYDLVTVSNTRAALEQDSRITAVTHTITPDKWLMTLGFAASGAVAPPTVTPPPSNGPAQKPKAPTGLDVDAAIVFVGKDPSVTLTASWDAVTQNTDDTDLVNLDHYELQTKIGAPASLVSWAPVASTAPDELTVTLTGYPVDQEISARVRAVNTKGVGGEWSAAVSTAGATDTGAPSTPSTPTTVTRLGVIRVRWDGLTAGGTAMPADFSYLEVHASTTNGFTPTKGDPNTLLETLFGAGYALKTDGAYGTTWYFKLIAVDTSGNASAPSAQASAATQALVNTDLIGQVIAGANIQDGTITASDKIVGNTITGGLIQGLAITAGKIASNAITADKIEAGAVTAIKLSAEAVEADKIKAGAVTADKITTGAITADKIQSGAVTADKISGTAIDGKTITGATVRSSGAVQRVQFDSTGIKGYNSSGFAHLVLGTDGSMTATDVFAGSLSATDSGTSITTNGDIIVGGKLFVNGIATNSDAGVGSDVRILGTNSLVKITSSERYKKNIRPAGLAVDAILGLEPCRYEDRTTGATGIGFIAERAHDAGLTEFVVYDDQGRPDSFSYPGFVVALQTVARQQHNEIAELKQQVADLAAAVAELRGQAT